MLLFRLVPNFDALPICIENTSIFAHTDLNDSLWKTIQNNQKWLVLWSRYVKILQWLNKIEKLGLTVYTRNKQEVEITEIEISGLDCILTQKYSDVIFDRMMTAFKSYRFESTVLLSDAWAVTRPEAVTQTDVCKYNISPTGWEDDNKNSFGNTSVYYYTFITKTWMLIKPILFDLVEYRGCMYKDAQTHE